MFWSVTKQFLPKQQKKVLLCSLLRYICLNVDDLFTKIECAQTVSVPSESETFSSNRKRKFCVLAGEG